jgi:glycosyltransferase involved in cell wall biosynthesis
MSLAKRALNVLFATPRFLPAQGGVENHVYQVARRLAAAGHRATVYTSRHDRSLASNDCIDGVQVRRFLAYPQHSDLFFSPDLYRAIRRNTDGFDVLHVQNYLTLVAPTAMLAARCAGLPYVVTFHGGGHSARWRNAVRGVQGLLLRPLLMRAHRLVATARFETGYYGRRLGIPAGKFTYVSNGCDIAVGHVSADRAGSPLLISIGRLERYKGHHRVLRAFPALLKRAPDAQLRIVGDGPFEPELRAMAQRLGVAHRVEIGGVPLSKRHAMAELLARAWLVVSMSDFETQPMAVLEAIAARRPVLVADTAGLSELAEQGHARAVPLDSAPEDLAQAMFAHMHSEPPAGDIALPTWNDCTDGLLALYREALAPGARASSRAGHAREVVP